MPVLCKGQPHFILASQRLVNPCPQLRVPLALRQCRTECVQLHFLVRRLAKLKHTTAQCIGECVLLGKCVPGGLLQQCIAMPLLWRANERHQGSRLCLWMQYVQPHGLQHDSRCLVLQQFYQQRQRYLFRLHLVHKAQYARPQFAVLLLFKAVVQQEVPVGRNGRGGQGGIDAAAICHIPTGKLLTQVWIQCLLHGIYRRLLQLLVCQGSFFPKWSP